MVPVEQTKAARHWQAIGAIPHHGVALPLSAALSHSSSGIGEYRDLKPLIDLCGDVGFDTIQLLPLGDSGLNASPYSGLSAFALNPAFLSLDNFEVDTNKIQILRQLSLKQRLPYREIVKLKRAAIREVIEHRVNDYLSDPDYVKFVEANRWLLPYALFRTLSEQQNFDAWTRWPDHEQSPTAALFDKHQDHINFFCIAQYLCHQQMLEVRRYADEKGIFLMGDIPILLNPNSADVWQYPHYFDQSLTVGAPPDSYSAGGQNWGFPLYRWDQMAPDYSWWTDRIKCAEQYYHIYRIDHVVGFFHLWAIPPGKTGREGSYIPRDFREALKQGNELLTMVLDGSKMLPIGEDLGVIPNEVRSALTDLGICGTKVMRWERYWKEDSSFIPPEAYKPLSMTCVSTHDSEPLRLWWEVCGDDARVFAHQMGWEWEDKLSKEHHRAILQMSHKTTSLFHINPLGEYLALIDRYRAEDPTDERINIPGTLSEFNWTYRLPAPIEEICQDEELKTLMKSMLA